MKTTTLKIDSNDIKESYKMLPGEQQTVIDIVYKWNAAHDTIHLDSLENYYNDPVLFFKKESRLNL